MKHIVIVDIDGTIAKIGDRLKYLHCKPKDWDNFYSHCDEDEPIFEIINLVKVLFLSYNVIFCSGRRESTRDKTRLWIFNNMGLIIDCPAHILLRSNNDFRDDIEVKPELLKKASIDLEEIAFVLEDRNTMVKKWREIGLICLQVSEGNF
jgi:hypothetical protein